MKIDSPKIPNDLPTMNFQDIFYQEDPELELCIINDSFFTNEMLVRPRLSQMIVKNCKFNNTDYNKIEITDVIYRTLI